MDIDSDLLNTIRNLDIQKDEKVKLVRELANFVAKISVGVAKDAYSMSISELFPSGKASVVTAYNNMVFDKLAGDIKESGYEIFYNAVFSDDGGETDAWYVGWKNNWIW